MKHNKTEQQLLNELKYTSVTLTPSARRWKAAYSLVKKGLVTMETTYVTENYSITVLRLK